MRARRRGAQGNALKTILPMAYVGIHHGDNAVGETIIEAEGVAHHTLPVDHIRQEPKTEHVRCRRLPLTERGWSIQAPPLWDGRYEYDLPRQGPLHPACYAWLNPHLTLTVSWDGKAR